MEHKAHIQTETGRRMLNAVTPIYTDEYQLSIFNANGLIIEDVHQNMSKINTETLINNATWSLPYWESLFRIKPKDNQMIEQRRRAVILKMNEYYPVTKRRMESIVDTFTENGGTIIDDERGDYIFEIILKNSGPIDLIGTIEAVEEAKPAHLDYQFLQENSGNPMFFGIMSLSGDETTIYPWTPRELSMEAKINLGTASQSHETMAVYPQQEG